MTIEELVLKIQKALPGADVYAQDLTGAGNHFEAVVVSDALVGKSRLQRHRLVMDPFLEDMKGPLHALTIKTYTQEEWANV